MSELQYDQSLYDLRLLTTYTGSGTTLSMLRDRLRKRLKDWPHISHLTALMTIDTSSMSITPGTESYFMRGGICRVGDEEVQVLAIDVATHILTVHRGMNGTGAAEHGTDERIDIFDYFADSELDDFINDVIVSLYPDLYRSAVDETLAFVTNTYSYDLPAAISEAEGLPYRLDIYDASNPRGQEVHGWELLPGGHIVIGGDYNGYTARIFYIAPFTRLTLDDSATDVPKRAERLVLLGAEAVCYEHLMADRQKFDRYLADVWRQNADKYSLSNYASVIWTMYNTELKRQRMTLPAIRRG